MSLFPTVLIPKEKDLNKAWECYDTLPQTYRLSAQEEDDIDLDSFIESDPITPKKRKNTNYKAYFNFNKEYEALYNIVNEFIKIVNSAKEDFSSKELYSKTKNEYAIIQKKFERLEKKLRFSRFNGNQKLEKLTKLNYLSEELKTMYDYIRIAATRE